MSSCKNCVSLFWIYAFIASMSGSRLPRGLRHELSSFDRWDHGFESHLRPGCLCMRLFCVCVVTRPRSPTVCLKKLLRDWRRGQGPARAVEASEKNASMTSKYSLDRGSVRLFIYMAQTGCSRLGPYQNCTVDDAEPRNQSFACSLLFLRAPFRSDLV
jgi:hypothetical protein